MHKNLLTYLQTYKYIIHLLTLQISIAKYAFLLFQYLQNFNISHPRRSHLLLQKLFSIHLVFSTPNSHVWMFSSFYINNLIYMKFIFVKIWALFFSYNLFGRKDYEEFEVISLIMTPISHVSEPRFITEDYSILKLKLTISMLIAY